MLGCWVWKSKVKMYNSLCLMLIWYGGAAYGTTSKNIEEEVNSYYSSANIQSFADKWKVHQASVENAIELSLKETFGNSGLNVYVKTLDDSHKVSDGFIVDDNIVHVLFKDMNLLRYPYLQNPRVSFPLHENVLQVEATVSKIFVDSKYLLFRNFSDVVYTAVQGGQGTSPFSLQQVQNRGRATIVVEHCILFGYAVATLQGVSVAIGEDNFKLHNCKFSLEISTPGVASAPLIVPYFSQKQGSQLERLLTLPLHRELIPKLQGAVLTCINTSSILGNLLPRVRKQQRTLLKKISDYMSNVIRSLNKIAINENAGSELWKDYRLSWTDKYDDNLMTSVVSLTNMTISGLDSAYSAHIGGPYKQRSVKIVESVRFSGIQFRGAGIFQVGTAQSQFIYSGEVQDVMTSTSIQIAMDGDEERTPKSLKPSKGVQTFEFRGWRNIEIHGPKSPLVNTYSFITGYMLNQIPVAVVSHLSRYCREAIDDTDNPNSQKTKDESIEKDISEEEKFNDNENGYTNLPSEQDTPNDDNENDNTNPPSEQDTPNNGNENDNKNLPSEQDTQNDGNENLPNDQDEQNDSKLSPANTKEGSDEPIHEKELADGNGFFKEPMFSEKFFSDDKNNPKETNENENTDLPAEQDAPNDGGTSLLIGAMFTVPFSANDNNNPTERNVGDLESSQDTTQDGDEVKRRNFKKSVHSRNYRRQKLEHMSDNEIN